MYYLLIVPILVYIYFRIIRPRVLSMRQTKPQHNIPLAKSFTFHIQVEEGSVKHDLAEETILTEVSRQSGIIIYSATPEDMTEYNARLEYNRGKIRQEEMKRLGYAKKGKKR